MFQLPTAQAASRRAESSPSLAGRIARLGLLAAVATAMAACSSAVKLEDGAPVEPRTAAGSASAGTDLQAGSSSQGNNTAGGALGARAGAGAMDPLKDPSSPLAKRSIYFDYDSYTVRDEFRSVIDAHARFLSSERNRRVIIQGNTDDRGSREYNLALGQKRAEAVRRSLTALGVPEAQLEAVSLGEEKPRATAGDDAARAENRRADLVYP
jgi:peptidoglycan-associated lipoprotein